MVRGLISSSIDPTFERIGKLDVGGKENCHGFSIEYSVSSECRKVGQKVFPFGTIRVRKAKS